jgi:hypothetical protein
VTKPVTFPPGCAKLATKPLPIGSATSENDRDGACLLQPRRGDRCALRNNEIGFQRDEFLRKSLHRLDVAGCHPAGGHPDTAALYPAEILKSLAQRRDAGLPYRIVRGEWHEQADAPHPLSLLCMRRERPCCRAAENGDEFPPPHSRASSSMVRPDYQMISHMALAIAASRWRVPRVKPGH